MEQLKTISGRPLPPLGFGFMRLPVLDENDRSKIDIETTKRMTDIYMKNGFGYFDIAHRYHDEAGENAIKLALTDRYPRNDYWLTNKITLNFIKRSSDQEPFFKKQLELCGVELFDLYLIHNVGAATYDAFSELGTFEFVEGLREKGLTRHTGISFHGTADVLERVLSEHPETDFVQLQLNYLDWNDPAIQSRKCYETALKYGCRILVMEPIKGGNLINLPPRAAALLKSSEPTASPASWALRFAAGHDGVCMVLSGMSSPEQVEDNVSFMKDFAPLSTGQTALLEEAADIIKENTAIECTSCRYCTSDCPRQIPIPDYFSLYNNYKRLKNVGYMYNQKEYYKNISAIHSKASECIKCGACEKNCPQSLPIRQLLAQVAEAFE